MIIFFFFSFFHVVNQQIVAAPYGFKFIILLFYDILYIFICTIIFFLLI